MSTNSGQGRRLIPTVAGVAVPSWVLRSGRRLTQGWGDLTAPLRPLPVFMLIGAKRSGTTSLYFHLLQHPAILPLFPSAKLLPKARDTKGVHYFDTEYGRGPRWYRSHFPSVVRRATSATKLGYSPVAGEASPYYLYHPCAPSRAAELNPSARLVAILRDPVERTHSHYREQRRNGIEKLSFAEALAAEPSRTAGEHQRLLSVNGVSSFPHEQQSYVQQSEYVHGIRRWLDHYPREQLLVVMSEDYYADPAATAKRVFQFVGIPALDLAAKRALNAAPTEPMDAEVRRTLTHHFAPLNRQLEELLGQRTGWS